MNDYTHLRNIQQFYYCPHRWGLMRLNCDWQENYFVAKGSIFHENVDVPDITKFGENYRCKSVSVYNDDVELFGIVDVLELKRSKGGVFVKEFGDKFDFEIIEYKNSSSKEPRIEDMLQVYGQKLCVDKMFGCDCKICFFYSDTKRRVPVEIDEMIKVEFKNTLAEMEKCMENNVIPQKRKGQKCSGCSLENLCLPLKNNATKFKELLKEIE